MGNSNSTSWLAWMMTACMVIWSFGFLCLIFVAVVSRLCPCCWCCTNEAHKKLRLRKKALEDSLVTKVVQRHDEAHSHSISHVSSTETYAPSPMDTDFPSSIGTIAPPHVPTMTTLRQNTILQEQGYDEEAFIEISLSSHHSQHNPYSPFDTLITPLPDSPERIEPNEQDENHCQICLESFHIGETVSWTKYSKSCFHVYHERCIRLWLLQHDDCPCCRGTFLRYPRVQYPPILFCCKHDESNDTHTTTRTISDVPSEEHVVHRSRTIHNNNNNNSTNTNSNNHRKDARQEMGTRTISEEEEEFWNKRQHAQFCELHGLTLLSTH